MADGVGVDGFGRKGRALAFGRAGVLLMMCRTPKRVMGEPLALRKTCWAAGSLGVRCLEIIVESFDRFGPQGTTSIFLALAQELHLRSVLQAQVCHLQFHDFADSSPGVVEQEQQCFVPDARARGEVHGVQARPAFPFLPDSRSFCAVCVSGGSCGWSGIGATGRVLPGR